MAPCQYYLSVSCTECILSASCTEGFRPERYRAPWISGDSMARPLPGAPFFVTALKPPSLTPSQVVQQEGVTFLLDGAHTDVSCAACATWFVTEQQAQSPTTRYLLLFNCAGPRAAQNLLPPFVKAHSVTPFAAALFCPNHRRTVTVDHTNNMASAAEILSGYHLPTLPSDSNVL